VTGSLEARWLRSREPVFRAEAGLEEQEFFIGTFLAVKFGVGLNSPKEP